MEWPEFYPDDCPPIEAQPTSGEYYRFIYGLSPEEQDFLAHRQMYPDKDFGKKICDASGLSVHKDIKDAISLARRIPNYRNMKLAKGKLHSDLGMILHTPSRHESSHHSWWLCVGGEPWKVFYAVELPEE